jgi:hypothetical protein
MRRPVTEEEAAGVSGVGGCAGIGVDTVAKLVVSEDSTPIIGKETVASKNVHKNFLP